tara:strand:+ start:25 stop:612 length:588 start_codon:yes stop_codon:yes gene_type:complete
MSQTEVQLIKSSSVVDGDIVGMASSKLSGALPAISGASLTNLPAGGITHASPWYLTTAFTGGTGTITSNLAAYTGAGSGPLGTQPTVSSGVFTLPATGIWNISWHAGFNINNDSRYNRVEIETTTDNSNYNKGLGAYCFLTDSGISGAGYTTQAAEHMFDCQDTSTHKVRFAYETFNSSIEIYVIRINFVRYGDT